MALRTRLRPAVLLIGVLVACSAPPGGSTAPSAEPSPSDIASTEPSATAPAFPLALTDDAGREITLATLPERIVSLAPSNTEIVCALGACDRLVGVTDADTFPAEVAEIDDVVIAAQVDPELVVAAEPDLVLAAGNEITPTPVIEQLDALGLTVMVLYPQSLDEVYADIEIVGRAIAAEAAADDLVSEMRDRVETITIALDGVERPRTLYEVYYAEGTMYTAGDGSFVASLIDVAGGEPVTGDATGLLAPEDLVAADPELILLGSASYDPALADAASALDVVAARPGWGDLTAVANGNVIPFLEDIVTTRPGPRIVDGLEALARAIHPEAFD